MSGQTWSPWTPALLGPVSTTTLDGLTAELSGPTRSEAARGAFLGIWRLRIYRTPTPSAAMKRKPIPRRDVLYDDDIINGSRSVYTLTGAQRFALRLLTGFALMSRVRAREKARVRNPGLPRSK